MHEHDYKPISSYTLACTKCGKTKIKPFELSTSNAPEITLGFIHRELLRLVELGATVESIRWVADNQMTTEDEK